MKPIELFKFGSDTHDKRTRRALRLNLIQLIIEWVVVTGACVAGGIYVWDCSPALVVVVVAGWILGSLLLLRDYMDIRIRYNSIIAINNLLLTVEHIRLHQKDGMVIKNLSNMNLKNIRDTEDRDLIMALIKSVETIEGLSALNTVLNNGGFTNYIPPKEDTDNQDYSTDGY